MVDPLAAQGLSVQQPSAALRKYALAPVLFAAPGCQGMLQVISVSLSLQEAPMLEAYLEPTFKRRYVYLGRIWLSADPFAMRVEWFKYKAFAILGLRRHAMPKTALVVAEPRIAMLSSRSTGDPLGARKVGKNSRIDSTLPGVRLSPAS